MFTVITRAQTHVYVMISHPTSFFSIPFQCSSLEELNQISAILSGFHGHSTHRGVTREFLGSFEEGIQVFIGPLLHGFACEARSVLHAATCDRLAEDSTDAHRMALDAHRLEQS